MSYASLMGYLRDPVYGGMWQDFENSPFQWGFASPRGRARLFHTRPRFASPESTSDTSCAKHGHERRAHKKQSCRMNEKMRQDREQSSAYPESASDLLHARPQSASQNFAPDPTNEVSSEHRLVPAAQKKRSRKINEKTKQHKQSFASPEISDDYLHSETESAVNTKPSEAEEKLERNQNQNMEGRKNEHKRSRSCDDSEPVYSADKTELEVEETNSQTENVRKSSEGTEQQETKSQTENFMESAEGTEQQEKKSQTENFMESSEDTEQMKETEEQERDEKNTLNEEHEADKDSTNGEVYKSVSRRLTVIDGELCKAKELLVRVQNFSGVKTDKEYLCLEELLLRCILSLDLVETEGRNEVRSARRAAVKEIQSIIDELEAKV